MKQLLTQWLIFLILFLMISCNDLINKEPLGKVSSDAAYVTSEDAHKAITAAYRPVALDGLATGGPGQMRWVFGNVAADNAYKGGFSGSDQLPAGKISHFTLTTTNSAVENVWDVNYIGIRRANLVLENVPDIEMDQKLKKRIIAESKFLRAYYYFQLVKHFGDVPLVLQTNLEASDIARTESDSVYDQIEKDLQAALGNLPTKGEYSKEQMGKATKGAAQAYLGKIYLYQGDFEASAEWFSKVIDSGEYSLDTDYYHMFTIDGEFGSGSIFEANHVYSSQYTDLGNYVTIILGSRGMYGWGFVNPTQDFVNAFEAGDPRLEQTVYAQGDTLPDNNIADVGNSVTGYMDLKAYLLEEDFPPSRSPRESGKNVVLMRLGKVLLWYAEAQNEIGKPKKALDALNRVRERARQGNGNILPAITTTDQKELRKIIWHEQRVEYGLEHERFFDLVRQDRAGEVLRNFSQQYNTDKGAGFKDGVNEVFPIPQTEIDLSTGSLKQNPGYN